MAVGLGEETPFLLDAEASGMVRRTVRRVRETRRNMVTNPVPTGSTDGWSSYNADLESDPRGLLATATTNNVSRWASPMQGGEVVEGENVTVSMFAEALGGADLSAGIRVRFRDSDGANLSLAQEVTVRDIPAGGGQITASRVAPVGSASLYVYIQQQTQSGSATPTGTQFILNDVSIERGTSGPYFDGYTPNVGGWEYRWEGQPNNSTSIAERVEYVDEYGTAEDGAPRVDLTVYNVPADTELEIRWRAAGEQGTVQGLKSWRVTDVGLATDWAAPLNREIVYTVYVDGDPQSSTTLTVHADQSWIQDPLHPDTALPVKRRGLDTGHLTLEQDAAKTGAYPTENTQTRVAGSKYPRFSGSMRGAATDVNLNLFTPDIPTTDAFAEMLADTPILLFRPHERMRPFPGAAYLAADIVETPIDQDDPGHQDGGFTKWEISGNLVQAIMQAVQSGFITYQDVQDLLGGYTYGEVQTEAASTLYLDWQKNPLIFTNL